MSNGLDYVNALVALCREHDGLFNHHGFSSAFIEVVNKPNGKLPIDVLPYNPAKKRALAGECKSGSSIGESQHDRYNRLDSADLTKTLGLPVVGDVEAFYFCSETHAETISQYQHDYFDAQLPVIGADIPNRRMALCGQPCFSTHNGLNGSLTSQSRLPSAIPKAVDVYPGMPRTGLYRFVLGKIIMLMSKLRKGDRFSATTILEKARAFELLTSAAALKLTAQIEKTLKDFHKKELKSWIVKPKDGIGWRVGNATSGGEGKRIKLRDCLHKAQERIRNM